MQLEGSCHCGAVSFSLISAHPYPYQRCYCSICRKTAGGGGFSINLGGSARRMKVLGGKRHLRIYRALLVADELEKLESTRAAPRRYFCSRCGGVRCGRGGRELALNSCTRTRARSTRHCRRRRRTCTASSAPRRRGSRSRRILGISSSTFIPKNPSPSGMSAWV